MVVYCYPADAYGCGHYRVRWPAAAAAAHGVDVHVKEPRESGIGGLAVGGKLSTIYAPADADVIVFQRPSNGILAQAVPLLRAQGIAVVVDVDDDLANIHPANPAFRHLHPKWNPANNWRHVASACRHATLVTVSTAALVPRYAAHGRVRVLDNYVPARFLDVERPVHDEPWVGWAGSMHSHPDDLRPAAGTLGQLARQGRRVHVVGDGVGVDREIGSDAYTSTGVVDFQDWMPRVAELDVAVAPLADTAFNQAKSRLKPLEYSAVGVPWVASPTREYARLAATGAGATAVRPRDWLRELRRLLDDDGYRAERSAVARAVAADNTIEAHGWRWQEAWQAAYEMEHPRVTA
jgi:glycosyltransferase involved in cell wall biosynthesis